MTKIIEWANQNDGFIGLLTFALITVLAPVLHFVFRRLTRRISNSVSADEVRRVEAIRAEFYANLKLIDSQSAFGPFLVRDIARDQLYFDGDDAEFTKEGAPPSFKVTIVDMSVHGIRVCSGCPVRIKRIVDDSTWCLAGEDDEGAVVAHPIGVIPFSSVVAINWHGDPATLFPHIFCRFDQGHGWPYKRFEYCERKPCVRGWDLYIPLVDADKLTRRKF